MSFKRGFSTGIVALTLAIPAVADAHCDTMDGPVIKAAQAALASGDITPALIWIQPAADLEVREAFTGIEPSGTDVGPIIPEADRALVSGSIDSLARMLSADLNSGLRTRFDQVRTKQAAMREGDVASGRAFVKAYVEFMHYAEHLHAATVGSPE
jgi:hypothetical protein